jgi:hypothetical protein
VLSGAALGMLLDWWVCRHPQGLLMPFVHIVLRWIPVRFLFSQMGRVLQGTRQR